MKTPRALASGLLLVGIATIPVLASPTAGAIAPVGSPTHRVPAAARVGAAAPDLEYDNALSVQWVPSSLPGGTGSRTLAEGSLAHAVLQYACAAPLKDARLQFFTTGPIHLLSPASVPLPNVRAFDPTRYAVAFKVDAGGSGGIEAKLSGHAPGGTFLRYFSVLNFATGGGHVAFAANGLLSAQANALRLQERALGSRRYQQRLAALEGGGARVTFSEPEGPSATPKTTTISGTIDYLAVNATRHPSRSIFVQIWDLDGTSPTGSLVASATTNSAGHYSATVSTLRPNGKPRDLYVEALAAASAFVIVLNIGDKTPWHISSPARTATGAAQTVDLTANNTANNNTAFDIADMLVTGDQYVLRIHDNKPFPRITVSYPNTGGTNFTPRTNTAKILLGDRFDWDVVLHEFGHYVAANLGIDTSQGGLHDWQDNLGQIYGKPNGITLAWSEGFATWFALTAEYELNVAALKVPNAGDWIFDDTEDANFHVPMATFGAYASTGEDNELSVARSLYHVLEDPDLKMSDLQIINALVAAKVDTLSKAVPVLMKADDAAPFGNIDAGGDEYPATAELKMNTFGCMLTTQVVSSQITSPAASDTVDGTPPTFTWVADGAGPSNRLDVFYVQFWSPTWGKLLFQSPVVNDPATDNSDSYTPAQADWNTLMAATDERGNYPTAMNVIVVGSDDNAPDTGPYGSCALPVSIAPPALTVSPEDTVDGVIAPIPSLCPGLFYSDVDEFVLNGSGLEPSTTYSLMLSPANNGYTDPTALTPSSVTTDAQGDITGAVIALSEDVPADNWPLILTPPAGRPATTTVHIIWDTCGETPVVSQGQSAQLYWGGAGVEPGTTVTIEWDGSQVDSQPAQPDGEYWYNSTTGPPTVTCTANDTVTIYATTYLGQQSISGDIACAGVSPNSGQIMARYGGFHSG